MSERISAFRIAFSVNHPGLPADAGPRARDRFGGLVVTALHAACALARWPHQPVWGPQRVAAARLTVKTPQKLGTLDAKAPTIVALVVLCALATDRIAEIRIVPVADRRVSVELEALEVEEVANVAERAAAAARASGPVVDSRPLRDGEPTPAEEYERVGLHVPRPEDWIERQVEQAETAEQRERSADPNAVTPLTLQREAPLAGHSSSKGRRRTVAAPSLSAPERNERFDRETRDLGMLTDVDRAHAALDASRRRLERPTPGRPLKGDSQRIKIMQRIPADLIVACASLGPDLESILVATASALKNGTLYAPPQQDAS